MSDPARLRNIGIVAHIDAGKTTLTEHILFGTGRQRHCGEVDAGTATMDWLIEEQQRGISIGAGVARVDWEDCTIQLIDTPGHVDFTAEVERCLRILDGAIVVLDGVRGVEPQTEAVWRSLDELQIPRVVFVNKLDRDVADFEGAVRSLGRFAGVRAVPVVIPVPGPDGFAGLADVVSRQVQTWDDRPAGDRALLAGARSRLEEACADLDDRALAAFCEGRMLDDEVLRSVIREGTRRCALVPVIGGSALHGRGIRSLLRAVCSYLPSPLDRSGAGRGDDDSRFSGLVFKVEPEFKGTARSALIRVYTGDLAVGDEVETARGAAFVIAGLSWRHGERHDPVSRAGPGDIVCIEGVPELLTGDTLRSPGSAVVLEPARFSTPVLTVRIEPGRSEDVAELVAAVRALASPDPTIRLGFDPNDGTLLVSGMGELHLEVFVERLRRRVAGPVRVGAPAVVRFETVGREATKSARCERRIGDLMLIAAARVRVVPRPDSGTPVFRWAADPAIGAELRSEILSALEGRVAVGPRSGLPARDVVVEVQELTWQGDAGVVEGLAIEAVELALRRAFEAGEPVLLEPRARLDAEVPISALSVVLADLRARGAAFDELDPGSATARVRATVRLGAMIGYATGLRSITQGRGRFELRPAGFTVALDSKKKSEPS